MFLILPGEKKWDEQGQDRGSNASHDLRRYKPRATSQRRPEDWLDPPFVGPSDPSRRICAVRIVRRTEQAALGTDCHWRNALTEARLTRKHLALITLSVVLARPALAADCSAAGVSSQVDDAVVRLAPSAPQLAVPVLRTGLLAFFRAKCVGEAHRDVLSIIDFTLPSSARRLWVLDVARALVLFHEHVAHGRGSGDAVASRFSDRPQSLASSLGLFITGATYSGKHGYSLKIEGREPGINTHAGARSVVVHPADYMTDDFIQEHGRAGRSFGCPALNPEVSRPLIDTIKGGSVLWAYYPDKHWLDTSTYLRWH